MKINSVVVADTVVSMFSDDYLELVLRMFKVVLGKRSENGDGTIIGTNVVPASGLSEFFKKDSPASLLLGGLTWDDHSNFILSLFEFGVAWGLLKRSAKGKGAGFSLSEFKIPEKAVKGKVDDIPADVKERIQAKLDLITDPDYEGNVLRLDMGQGGFTSAELPESVWQARIDTLTLAIREGVFGKRFKARGGKFKLDPDYKAPPVSAAA